MAAENAPKRMGRPPGPTASSELRIEEIAATLRDGSYRHGVTLPAFAKKWELSEHRTAEIAGLAAKKVRSECTDPERVAAKSYSRLEKIADDAMAEYDKDGNNTGHRKLALQATVEHLKLSGVAAPTRAQVAVSDDLSALTAEQLAERKRAIVARLAGEDVGRLAKGAK